jgi:hypothetical protein
VIPVGSRSIYLKGIEMGIWRKPITHLTNFTNKVLWPEVGVSQLLQNMYTYYYIFIGTYFTNDEEIST